MAKVTPEQQVLPGRHRRPRRDPPGTVHTFHLRPVLRGFAGGLSRGERAGVVVLEWVEPLGGVILIMAVVGGMLGLVGSLMITHHLVPQLRWLK